MKVAFYTLGCKVNQNDTNSLAAIFQKRGYQVVPFHNNNQAAGADIFVINTCAVTKIGERKSRQIIYQAIALNPKAIVVVTGCYAQTASQAVAGIDGVNLVIGIADRPRIVDLIEEYRQTRTERVWVSPIDRNTVWEDLPLNTSGERTRATLKIEDGCDQFCSFCIVPYARGRVRSMPISQVIKEFQLLLEAGFKEIVITGIHLGSYGKDLNCTLAELLNQLTKITGEFRIRLGSIEPNDFSEELIAAIINNPQVCQYLHIPLQSGSDRILELMNRKYNLTYFEQLLQKLREQNPRLGVGTDLIVGFPGETEADFVTMSDFILKQRFSRIHVFRYSPRQGTVAATLPNQIPPKIQEERSRQIHKLATQTSHQFVQKFIGQSVTVLFEEPTVNGWQGLSGEYLRVIANTSLNLKNKFWPVLITNCTTNNFLEGICISN